jgi:hypothetical protein
MIRSILVLLVSCLFCAGVFAQAAWKLTTEENGVKIYSRSSPDSKIKTLKVETELEATVSQLVALLIDVPASENWVYHTKSCTLIRKVSASEMFYHTEASLPWPLSNRDFVSHMRIHQDPVSKVVTVDAPAIPGEIPPKKGIVRVTNGKGSWVITPFAKDRVRMEYTLMVDPGGYLPAHIVNIFAVHGSLETVKGMKKLLPLPKYKNANLSFILK